MNASAPGAVPADTAAAAPCTARGRRVEFLARVVAVILARLFVFLADEYLLLALILPLGCA